MNDLLEKLETIYQRCRIGEEISQPDIMADMKRYIKLNKDYKDLQPVVDAYKEYRNVLDNIDHAKRFLLRKDESLGNGKIRTGRFGK